MYVITGVRMCISTYNTEYGYNISVDFKKEEVHHVYICMYMANVHTYVHIIPVYSM